MKTRMESDALGTRELPETTLYGIHTLRSLENFPLSGIRMPMPILYGMTRLKWACAQVNARFSLLSSDKSEAIIGACRDILQGKHDEAFLLDMFQAGSGTSSHMNLNEVIANLANQAMGAPIGKKSPIHPNDHVNMGQSTNDVFPSGAKLAVLEQVNECYPALQSLIDALRAKEKEFSTIFKSGRTHLQDAVPVTLGQEFGAWARALEVDLEELNPPLRRLRELAVGGNAIGTGVNTPPEFRDAVIQTLNEEFGFETYAAKDGIHSVQFLTDFSRVSAAIRATALDIQKLCNDLRLLSSGPHTGLDEIRLPPVEPGSSIMPGKINPSICEAVNMVCIHIQGLDLSVSLACGAAQLELNTHMPLIAVNTLQAVALLTQASWVLAQKCVLGIEAQESNCRIHLEKSAGLPTILNTRLGYDRVATLVKESVATGMTLRELAIKHNILTDAEYDALVQSSISPNRLLT